MALQTWRLQAMKNHHEAVKPREERWIVTPGEQGQSHAEVKSPPRKRGYAAWLRADPAEDRARQRARWFGFALMLASSVVSLLVLYGVWKLVSRL